MSIRTYAWMLAGTLASTSAAASDVKLTVGLEVLQDMARGAGCLYDPGSDPLETEIAVAGEINRHYNSDVLGDDCSGFGGPRPGANLRVGLRIPLNERTSFRPEGHFGLTQHIADLHWNPNVGPLRVIDGAEGGEGNRVSRVGFRGHTGFALAGGLSALVDHELTGGDIRPYVLGGVGVAAGIRGQSLGDGRGSSSWVTQDAKVQCAPDEGNGLVCNRAFEARTSFITPTATVGAGIRSKNAVGWFLEGRYSLSYMGGARPDNFLCAGPADTDAGIDECTGPFNADDGAYMQALLFDPISITVGLEIPL